MKRAVIPAAAVLVAGLALYFSRGVLDQVVAGGGPIRVALLPPWQALVGFCMVGVFGLVALARWTARPGTDRPRLAPLTLPVFGLVLLLVPYLPGLADWIPALQILAGPFATVVWIVVIGLLAWTLWQTRQTAIDWLDGAPPWRVAILIGGATAAIAAVPATRLTGTVVFPSGDEPHYLVIAQSLWRDGDLKIENNHARGDYREYFRPELKPDFLTRGADGEIYSIHPVGLPVLMSPVYALGGYRAVVAVLILCAAAAAALMWHAVVRLTGTRRHATFAWAAIALTAPFLFNTFTVYPEMPAALAVVIAISRLAEDAWPGPRARWLVIGVACALLPWLSTKYSPMSAALVAIALGRIWWPGVRLASLQTAGMPTALVILPYAISLAGWFTFFYSVWGTPLPQAPYGALVQTSPKNLIFGAPGLLFDQEYGLLAYAPVYILAATGLATMWREGGDLRRRAIEHTLAFAALLGTVGAFRIWWGGTSSPARPLASGLLLLALPMAFASRAALSGSAQRAGQHLLLWLGAGVALVLMTAQNGALVTNGRDGTSNLLEYLSPRWAAWALAPTFIHHEAPIALLHSVAWLLVAAAAAWILRRARTRGAGAATLVAMTTMTAALLLLVLVVPRLPHEPPLPGVSLSARARLPLMDHYDAIVRPLGVRYDPLRVARASDIAATASLELTPESRLEPPPIRLLHNGRFSLPPGRYRIDAEWAADLPAPVELGLQAGRLGHPWRSWTVQPRRGDRWSADFALPIDVGFVGFRGPIDLERVTSRIAITPLALSDAARRPPTPPVLAAAQYGETPVFFHDEYAFIEPAGFWVRGERATQFTVPTPSTAPLRLRLHSGIIANRAVLSMDGWQQQIDLTRETPVDVALPPVERETMTLRIAAEKGFNPRDVDPASRDPRFLGIWVAFVHQGQP